MQAADTNYVALERELTDITFTYCIMLCAAKVLTKDWTPGRCTPLNTQPLDCYLADQLRSWQHWRPVRRDRPLMDFAQYCLSKDGYPGGAGFAERGFRQAHIWLGANTADIQAGKCPNGCLLYVQYTQRDNDSLIKPAWHRCLPSCVTSHT